MEESDAIDALERLGLTNYEAQVFVALQRLGVGSASDVDRVADVPRSQVYGAAENLEAKGLVEVQQSNPIRYRAVGLDEAKARLRGRYEREQDRAFDYLETIQADLRDADEQREDIWTIRGREAVDARAADLVRGAERRIVYAVSADALDLEFVDLLGERAADGVAVTVVSADDEVLDRVGDVEGVDVRAIPDEFAPEDRKSGRFLVVDGDTVLLSVLGDETTPGIQSEAAIWTAGTGFAEILVGLLTGRLDQL